MQPNTTNPRWFHTFRGFVFGLGAGCVAMTLAYESNAIPLGDSIWKRLYFPLALNLVPLLLLAPFEIYFGVRRYRALRREIDARTAAT